MKWTDEETKLLIELRRNKTPIKEIARVLNRSVASVNQRIKLNIFDYDENGNSEIWMNDELIRREYRLAKDPAKQIDILAALNNVSVDIIKRIITE